MGSRSWHFRNAEPQIFIQERKRIRTLNSRRPTGTRAHVSSTFHTRNLTQMINQYDYNRVSRGEKVHRKNRSVVCVLEGVPPFCCAVYPPDQWWALHMLFSTLQHCLSKIEVLATFFLYHVAKTDDILRPIFFS